MKEYHSDDNHQSKNRLFSHYRNMSYGGYWLGLEPDKTMVEAYGESLAKYEETEQPEEKHLGYVLNQLGLFFEKAGYFSEAISLLRRALEITEKVLGKEHPDTATSLNNLAGIMRKETMIQQKRPTRLRNS